MNKVIFNLFLILIVILSDLMTGCKDKEHDQEKVEDNVTIQGIVIDQVSRLPVEGATIYSASHPWGTNGYSMIPEKFVKSDKSGLFLIDIPAILFDPNTIRLSLRFPRIYASKDGYGGSNYYTPEVNRLNTLELYHTATLLLTVINDTIKDDIDKISIGLAGSWSFMSYPGFVGRTSDFGDPYIIKQCEGRNFNMVYEFTPLWGNLEYNILVRKPNLPWSVEKTIMLKPDSTIKLTMTF